MKDKYKELDNIFSKENKYEDKDDIPMKTHGYRKTNKKTL